MEEYSSEFSRLCTFESFKEIWPGYSFGSEQQQLIRREFSRLNDITYLDHAGTTFFAESQVKSFYEDISRNVYGNPHSLNPSSKMTHDTVERVRYRILEHFNTSPEEYSVIFTAGCTAALKLVADSFPWTSASDEHSGSQFCYLTDNHTSVVGIRGVTEPQGVGTVPVFPQEIEARAKASQVTMNTQDECLVAHLFCYPAQSNFSGRKYPLSYVRGIQRQQLYPACEHRGRWFVLLDASGFVGCSPLDLKQHPADFVPISFYKMFGFPTGLGALVVRNEAAELLKKKYFGGGTAAAYLVAEDYFVPKSDIVSRFEDGTISFLDIISLHHGFDALHRLTGSMMNIQLHTFGLARYTYIILSCLCHSNAQPVAQIYCDSEFENATDQGAILNFNLLDCYGQVIGYYQVDKMACLFNIHLRTGCFCNTGACQTYLGISNEEVKSNLQAGHVCGDNIDLIDGRPTGSVRISFGYMSTFEDCQCLLKFIVDCFVEKPLRLNQKRLATLKSAGMAETSASNELTSLPTERPVPVMNGLNISPASVSKTSSQDTIPKEDRNSEDAYTLTNIFIYPIKSCAAFEVTEWPLGPQGLLYDRIWMVVNENGICLSQKREPKLCLINPHICLTSKTLYLEASGMDPITLPLEISQEKDGPRPCQSKVCGDRVQTVDCGEEVSVWLSKFLGKPCCLIRQSPSFARDMRIGKGKGSCPPVLSLVNEAQFLLINRSSVALLLNHIINRQDSSNNCTSFNMLQLINRFRANLVISGSDPFEEEDWTSIKIGGTHFQVAGKCSRCQMIGIDQTSGTKSQEPLRSLSDCRNGKVTFGVYLNHLLQRSYPYPTLSVGSRVTTKPTAEF
ncbi:molybdenum cofactor sulfurase isoform X2 [Pangasianodon hypophthalmus]|uniref:molybdenum cofactor sulfurase isoform X2 n=1 Tax=Pangasianodon hypophthalmus TaxID=310915 RepID=UPI000F002F6F|nr:molybdenum cofactor sulfurase isoform X2 [Pangasianodon hypophthalmus]